MMRRPAARMHIHTSEHQRIRTCVSMMSQLDRPTTNHHTHVDLTHSRRHPAYRLRPLPNLPKPSLD